MLNGIDYFFGGLLIGFWIAIITVYIASKDVRAIWNKKNNNLDKKETA